MLLRIDSEAELYNPYDPTQTRINDKVYSYLKSFCTEADYEKHLSDTLQIICSEPVDIDRFRSVLEAEVQKDLDEFDRQIAQNRRRVILGYVIGIVLSAAGVGLALLLDQVLLAIISFLGTSAVSDAFTTHSRLNPEIRRQKKLMEPLRELKFEVIRQ